MAATMASVSEADGASEPYSGPTERIDDFLRSGDRETPFLVVDLDVVAARYRQLADSLPGVDVFFAVKANPAPEILEMLVRLGAHFDVASTGEIDACLAAGADPSTLSFGNTVKKRTAIRDAYARGMRIFAFDSEEELDKLIDLAPRATVFCRMLCDGSGADWPLSRKFGCDPDVALALLLRAARAGLDVGMSFHVGSQQRDPWAWDRVLALVADQFAALRAEGVEPAVVNIGGGFPGHYVGDVPATVSYGAAITESLARRLGPDVPRVIAEPGRYLVADAGLIRTEVVTVARKSRFDEQRWVYLDIGLFGGLAETLGEAIRYRIRTPHDGEPHGATGPVVLAGPTCDSADVLYERADYQLPLALAAGDQLDLLSAGAYTATYSTVGFNGFPPLRTYYLAQR